MNKTVSPSRGEGGGGMWHGGNAGNNNRPRRRRRRWECVQVDDSARLWEFQVWRSGIGDRWRWLVDGGASRLPIIVPFCLEHLSDPERFVSFNYNYKRLQRCAPSESLGRHFFRGLNLDKRMERRTDRFETIREKSWN